MARATVTVPSPLSLSEMYSLGIGGEEDIQGRHELWESRQIYKLVY